MKKIYVFLVAFLALCTLGVAQPILQESFEGSFPPAGWTLINNGTGNDWIQNTTATNAKHGSKSMMYRYNITNAADAWAITPAVTLNTNPCTITFWVKIASTTWPENLKFTVGTGNTVGDQSTVLLDSAGLLNTSFRQWSVQYTAPTAGDYYFGFNCYSPMDQDFLYVDSITISQLLPACTGTPVGGNAESSVASICPGIPFDLSVTGSTCCVSGLTYQWDSSTNGGTNFYPIAGATNPTYTSGGISSATIYRRHITCSGNDVLSQTVSVAINAITDCYCSPNTGITLHSSTGPTIENTEIVSTTLNISDPGAASAPSLGYVLHSDPSTTPDLTQAVSYTINITASAAPGGAGIWIDWNKNGQFEASEYISVPVSAAMTATITVPTNAQLGQTLMRVRVRSVTITSDACATYGSGETEDFTINILAGVQCAGNPTGGTTGVNPPSPLCSGAPFIVSITGSSSGVGITYQWQSSTTGTSGWADISGRINDTLQISGISSNIYYRRVTLCSAGGSGNSDSILVAVNGAAALPFTEDFESLTTFGAGIMPNCWKAVIQSGTNFTSANTPVRNGVGPHGGTNYAWSRWSSNAWLISSGVQLTAGQSYAFSYYYQPTDATAGFTVNTYVGTSADTASLSAATLLGTIVNPIDNTQFTQAYYIFTAPSTGVFYFGVKSMCPSASPWYLVFDDFNTESISGCTGTPVGGTTDVLPASPLCAGAPFNLSVTGSTIGTGGLTYQWLSSTNGTNYAPIAGATNQTLSVTGVSNDTYYRRIITCTGSNASDTSVAVLVGINTSSVIPFSEDFESLTTFGSGIVPNCWKAVLQSGTNFTSANVPIRNGVGPHGGTNYAWSRWSSTAWLVSSGVKLTAGQNYVFSYYYQPTDAIAGFTVNTYVGTSSDTASLGAATLLGTIVDPIDNTQFTQAYYIFTAPSTGVFYFGVKSICPTAAPWYLVFDDFNADIISSCTGTPVGGTTDVLPASPLCAGAPFNLSVSGSTSGTGGLTYQWLSSTNGTTYVPISGATNQTLSVSGISSDVYYRRIITCTGSNASDTSLAIQVGINTPSVIPFIEDFESLTTFGAGILPNCWSNVLGSGTKFTSANAPVRNGIGPHGGTNYVWSHWSSNTWLISSGVQLTAGQNYEISYYYQPTDAIAGFLVNTYIGTSSDTGILASSTLLGTIVDPVDNTQYTQAVYSFTAPTSGVYYLGLRSVATLAPWYLVFDDFKIDALLPVSFTSFSGEKQGVINLLKWTTATEVNNTGFSLERSIYGKDFKSIGFINTKSINGSSSSVLNYNFRDEKPFNGSNYYRLKQIDKDGKSSYSNVVLIKGVKPVSVEIASIYPNPATDDLKIAILSPTTNLSNIVVSDMYGKIVSTQKVKLNTGDNFTFVNVSNLATGSYTIKVTCDNGCETASKKFVKN